MFTPVIAANIQEMAGKFGLHTDIFIAHLIAFAILVAVVVFFGVKPIMKQLEERRARIEEGEAMHAQSQKELAEVKATGEQILADAHAQGKKEIEHARQTAAKVQADLTDKAAAEARTIIENARTQAELDTQREKNALKGEFARLIAVATSQVTGKVLSEADHRAINEEAIRHL
ncbi:MAG: ATP synthase F0 subunit B [Akkermansia sp.]|nr:ATP synthase F0 subunit B [Akkermansia sp.]